MEGADPYSHTLAEEEHLNHSHMTEFDHTHMQVAGVGKPPAEDTAPPEGSENLAAIAIIAHTLVAPDRGYIGTLAAHMDFAAETADPAGDGNQTQDEVKAVGMDGAKDE